MAKIVPIDDMSKQTIRLPGPRDRVTVVGSTGSGKTQAAMWHLSNATYDVRPWIIVDPKIDENIARIEGVEEIELGTIPANPGLYVIHPLPSQLPELDKFFSDVWEHENIGLYCDESYMCGNGPGFLACLTQGRSKRIPMIMLTQRPVDISRFCFSEANFYQIFQLTDKRDKVTVRNFAPIPEYYKGEHLPRFYSWYYDVNRHELFVLSPVPSLDIILENIQVKLDAIRESERCTQYATLRRM